MVIHVLFLKMPPQSRKADLTSKLHNSEAIAHFAVYIYIYKKSKEKEQKKKKKEKHTRSIRCKRMNG